MQEGKAEGDPNVEELKEMEEVYLKLILSSCKNLQNGSKIMLDDIDQRLHPLLK